MGMWLSGLEIDPVYPNQVVRLTCELGLVVGRCSTSQYLVKYYGVLFWFAGPFLVWTPKGSNHMLACNRVHAFCSNYTKNE
jgi:hypothetical protein